MKELYQMKMFTALTPDHLEKIVNGFFLENKGIDIVSIKIEKMDIYLTCSIIYKISK